MALKKEPEKHVNHERWLVSYGDFITLLFAVFVVLYAMGQTDKKKTEEIVVSMQQSFGILPGGGPGSKAGVIPSAPIGIIPSLKPEISPMGGSGRGRGRAKGRAEEQDFRQIKSSIEAYLIKQGAQQKVNLSITRRGLIVSLKEAGFFDSGQAVIKSSSYELVNTIAEAMTQYNNPLRLEGHTDSIPISSSQFPSNWELSTARAVNGLKYLLTNFDVDPNKISATGYGEFRPIADNSTAEGRARNRRVDLVLLSAEGERGEP
ncbi:MAG TPA: flagellar motor protein MotB [Deltaproteobacteria bacterium]|nr:flagellar motor protein MotB [Deltaproteobacteria bacterium]HQB38873.1 flagellar motor protein MotB [Deltaproteobacteria bacterium]